MGSEEDKLHGIFPILDADEKDRKLDIVFIHGIDGDAEKTWGDVNENFWPEWLSKDFDDISVWTIGYDATPSAWFGETMPMQDRAYDILNELSLKDSIGQRPIMFIVHSMGGLILKYMLDISQRDPDYRHIFTQTKGISFIAVPHEGAAIANYLSMLSRVLRFNSIVEQLEKNSPALSYLDDAFISIAKEKKLQCISFFERNEILRPKKKLLGLTFEGKGIKVVSESSARGRFDQPRPYGISRDHITICKLVSKNDKVYKNVSALIQKVLDDTLNENNIEKKYTDIENSLPETEKFETPSPINQIFLIFNEDNLSDVKYEVIGYIQTEDEFESEVIEFTFEDINNTAEQENFLEKLIKEAELDDVPIHFILPPSLFLINFKQWKHKGNELVKLHHTILHNKEIFTRKIGKYKPMIEKWNSLFETLKNTNIADALMPVINDKERFDVRTNKIGVCLEYHQSSYDIVNETLVGAYMGLWQYPSGLLLEYQGWIKSGLHLSKLNNESRNCDHMALLWDDMSLLENLKRRV